jgi:hypothetical protein
VTATRLIQLKNRIKSNPTLTAKESPKETSNAKQPVQSKDRSNSTQKEAEPANDSTSQEKRVEAQSNNSNSPQTASNKNSTDTPVGIPEIIDDLKKILADFEQLSAHTSETYNSAKTSLAGGLKTVGDKIESLGQKLKFGVVTRLGKSIEKLGDKVDNSNELTIEQKNT